MAEQETDAVRGLLDLLEAVPAERAGIDGFRLVEAMRAVLDLADKHAGCCGAVQVHRLRRAVAEALGG